MVLALLALSLRLLVLFSAPALATTVSDGDEPGGTPFALSALCLGLGGVDASGIQNDEAGSDIPIGGAHDPAHCICATGCFHGAHFLAIASADGSSGSLRLITAAQPCHAQHDLRRDRSGLSNRAIRAPPLA